MFQVKSRRNSYLSENEEEDVASQKKEEQNYSSQEVELLDKSYYIIDDYYQGLNVEGAGLSGKSFSVKVLNW